MSTATANSECFRLNREIAYKGIIGRRRQEFCFEYIKRKKAIIKDIEQDVMSQIEDIQEAIICHKGCSACCVAYIEAELAECEAIVYHLYQNEDTLSLFLEQYLKWRAHIKEYGDLFHRCEHVLRELRDNGKNEKTRQELADALFFYKMQNIPCPFLHENICIIHEVRPFTCASHYVTTPADWCSPLNPEQPKIYKSNLSGSMPDLAFYYGSSAGPVILFMPMAVNKILKCGFYYLSEVIYNEGLWEDVINDPEVMADIRRYRK